MRAVAVSKPIYITESAFRTGLEGSSRPTEYRINVNDEVMRVLYTKFKEHKGLPLRYPISDKARFEFEDLIFSLIDKGKIVVKKK